MSRSEVDPQLIESLTALARTQLRGHAPHRGERSFERVRDQLHRERAGARSETRPAMGRAALGWAAAVGTLAAGVALLLAVREPQLPAPSPAATIAYRVDGEPARPGRELRAERSTRVLFSDGSRVELAKGAHARVAALDARGGHLQLVGGAARVDIDHRPRARWSVDAGPYEVRVTGTSFDLSWSSAYQSFELSMHEGEVWVTGPLIESPMRLRAGQRLRTSVEQHTLAIDEPERAVALAPIAARQDPGPNAEPPTRDHGVPPPRAVPAVAHGATDRTLASTGDHVQARAPGPHDKGLWARLLAQGDFDTVVRDAEARGVARSVATAPLGELSALADAARFRQHRQLARRSLQALRRRFPQSPAAADAAFLLGRLDEDLGASADASRWYARYLTQSPSGPHAADALGRAMLLRQREQGADAAMPLAERYLQRHSRGSYADAARRIVAEVTSTR